jgi:hypothetical protein
LAVVLEHSVRCGPTPYIRPFDPDAGRFTAGGSYRPESFWTWVLGDSQIACFVDEGRRHRFERARRLRLEIVGRRGEALHVEPIWADSTYVEVGRGAMNDRGDVVALVNRVLGDGRGPISAKYSWALLIVPRGSPYRLREVENVSNYSRVAISADGKWIALSMDDGAIRVLDSQTLRAADADRSLSQAAADARLVSAKQLVIANDRAIAAVAFACVARESCETRLVFARPGLELEAVHTFGSDTVDVELQFFAQKLIYVATPGRPAFEILAIGGGIHRHVDPVEAAAWAFEY